jgi:hypothetical protein
MQKRPSDFACVIRVKYSRWQLLEYPAIDLFLTRSLRLDLGRIAHLQLEVQFAKSLSNQCACPLASMPNIPAAHYRDQLDLSAEEFSPA